MVKAIWQAKKEWKQYKMEIKGDKWSEKHCLN